jgi:hypothetical protein
LKRTALLACIVMASLYATAGTAIAGTPLATTDPATNVAATTATLNGTVFPNKESTTYYFEYGTTTAYGSRTPNQGPVGGNAGKSASANITGLAPSTTYHYRVVAVNPSAPGGVFGNDRTFTTLAPGQQASAVTIAATPPAVTFGNASSVHGTVTGPGNAGATVVLEQNPFPFTGQFQQVATATTDASGNYAFQVRPALNTRYHVIAKTSPPMTSPDVTVNVRPRVTLKLSDTTPRAGQLVRFSGFVTPGHDGRSVRIQRHTRKGWRTIATPVLKAATPLNGVARSKYSRRIRIRSSAYYRTVFVPADGDHVTGRSARKHARVH